MHNLEPFGGVLDPLVGTMVRLPSGRAVSPVHALIALWTAGSNTSAEELLGAYETCFYIAMHGFSDSAAEAKARYGELVLRQLTADADRLPAGSTGEMVRLLQQRVL
jgi:hypothetical protein